MKPLKSAFTPQFIASNQADRANNCIKGSNKEAIEQIRTDIREFKKSVDKVIVLWTANTEETVESIHNLEQLDRMIEKNSPIPASVLYAYATLMENVTYLNGSPQNTLHPAIVSLAEKQNACVAGADFKSGQTRFKTMMGDFFTGCGIKLASVVSYNHLGNNDGKNLNEAHTFKSKETSKSGCLDDAIVSNKELYP
jgi:myo-inositol-1-phosphate synthase